MITEYIKDLNDTLKSLQSQLENQKQIKDNVLAVCKLDKGKKYGIIEKHVIRNSIYTTSEIDELPKDEWTEEVKKLFIDKNIIDLVELQLILNCYVKIGGDVSKFNEAYQKVIKKHPKLHLYLREEAPQKRIISNGVVQSLVITRSAHGGLKLELDEAKMMLKLVKKAITIQKERLENWWKRHGIKELTVRNAYN